MRARTGLVKPHVHRIIFAGIVFLEAETHMQTTLRQLFRLMPDQQQKYSACCNCQAEIKMRRRKAIQREIDRECVSQYGASDKFVPGTTP